VANGACKDASISIGGAEVGDAVLFSVVDPVPEGVLLYGVGVPSDGHMTLKACNFTGGAFPVLSNIAIRALTFGRKAAHLLWGRCRIGSPRSARCSPSWARSS